MKHPSCWLIAAVLAAPSCAPSHGLPKPDATLTPTPDAEFRAHPPELPTRRLLRRPSLAFGRLANGLRLIVAEDDDLETATILLAVRDPIAGNVLPNSERDALPALTLEVLRQDMDACCGSASYTGTSLSRAGAQLRVSASPDSLKRLLSGVANAVSKPAERASFERARTTKGLPWLRAQTQVFRSINAVSDALLYGEQPPDPSVLHLDDYKAYELPAVSLEQLRDFRKAHYRPQSSALIVVGPVTLDEVEGLIGSAFDGWTVAAAPPAPSPRRARGPRRAFRYTPLRPDSDFAVMSVPCAGVSGADRLPLDVLGAWLESMGSALARNLRHESGISYHWSAGCDGEDGSATFHVHLTSAPGESAPAIEAVLVELSRLAAQPLTPNELKQAGTVYLAEQASQLSSSRRAAYALGDAFLAGRPDDHYDTLERRVRAITGAQLQSVANRYFETGPMTIVASARKLELRQTPRLAAAIAAGR
jgi:predicted Zn-dependent peptidase